MESLALLTLLAVAGVAWMRARSIEGEASQGAGWELMLSLDNLGEELRRPFGLDALPEDGGQQNLEAFLWAIRHAEGTAGPDGYRTMFGGALFDGWADHPRRAVQFTDRAGRRLWTSAAGAYQFMAVSPTEGGRTTAVNTWDRLKYKLALPDFSPASQDRAAVALIDEAGALMDVRAGRFAVAVDKVRRIWASLPGAGYQQGERSLAWLQEKYEESGGNIA